MAFRLGLTLDLDDPSVFVDNNAAKLCALLLIARDCFPFGLAPFDT
jgi:hypothetical protein